jgi:hypothetical protein
MYGAGLQSGNDLAVDRSIGIDHPVTLPERSGGTRLTYVPWHRRRHIYPLVTEFRYFAGLLLVERYLIGISDPVWAGELRHTCSVILFFYDLDIQKYVRAAQSSGNLV